MDSELRGKEIQGSESDQYGFEVQINMDSA